MVVGWDERCGLGSRQPAPKLLRCELAEVCQLALLSLAALGHVLNAGPGSGGRGCTTWWEGDAQWRCVGWRGRVTGCGLVRRVRHDVIVRDIDARAVLSRG